MSIMSMLCCDVRRMCRARPAPKLLRTFSACLQPFRRPSGPTLCRRWTRTTQLRCLFVRLRHAGRTITWIASCLIHLPSLHSSVASTTRYIVY